MLNKRYRETLLRRALEADIKAGTYDYIIIDSPPSMANIFTNVLHATNIFIIPVKLDDYDIDGLEYVLKLIIKEIENIPTLKIGGVVINGVQNRKAQNRINLELIKQTLEQHSMSNMLYSTKFVIFKVEIILY